MKIVAIGGGEIADNETLSIDKRILELTGKKHPKLLFIPTASSDSKGYCELIKKHFTRLECESVDTLLLSQIHDKKEIENKILNTDAIYVGGGNTLRMMKTWRRLGVDDILRKAAEKDIVLSGISAGSICWFKYGNSDSKKFTSGSDQLIKVTGLGLINALHCPHYNTQVSRQKDLKRMMKNTPKLVGVALDDCSALEVVDDKYRIIQANKNAKARKTYWKNGEYIAEEIHYKVYKPLSILLEKK